MLPFVCHDRALLDIHVICGALQLPSIAHARRCMRDPSESLPVAIQMDDGYAYIWMETLAMLIWYGYAYGHVHVQMEE